MNVKSRKQKCSIFIVNTPFHVMIVEKLIVHLGVQKYGIIYMTENENPKHRAYYERIEKGAIYTRLIKLCKNPIADTVLLAKCAYKMKKHLSKYQLTIFSGNIKKVYSRLMVALLGIPNKYVNTFDDGTGNISGEGYFYNPKESVWGTAIFSIFRQDLKYKKILQRNHKHYTVFNAENVFANTEKVSFIDKNVGNVTSIKPFCVLLGNAFYEDGILGKKVEEKIYRYILRKFNIDLVILHPRALTNKGIPGNLINENEKRVAEDIIMDIAQRRKVKVLGIYSTAMITISSVPSIEVVNISIPLNKPTIRLEELFRRNGIKMIKLDGLMLK